MYQVWMYRHHMYSSRVWTNRVRLLILLVVSWTGKIDISLSPYVRAWEFGLARRVRPFRPLSACSFSILMLNLVLTDGIPPDFRGGVHLFIFVCEFHDHLEPASTTPPTESPSRVRPVNAETSDHTINSVKSTARLARYQGLSWARDTTGGCCLVCWKNWGFW